MAAEGCWLPRVCVTCRPFGTGVAFSDWSTGRKKNMSRAMYVVWAHFYIKKKEYLKVEISLSVSLCLMAAILAHPQSILPRGPCATPSYAQWLFGALRITFEQWPTVPSIGPQLKCPSSCNSTQSGRVPDSEPINPSPSPHHFPPRELITAWNILIYSLLPLLPLLECKPLEGSGHRGCCLIFLSSPGLARGPMHSRFHVFLPIEWTALEQ